MGRGTAENAKKVFWVGPRDSAETIAATLADWNTSGQDGRKRAGGVFGSSFAPMGAGPSLHRKLYGSTSNVSRTLPGIRTLARQAPR